MTNPSKGDESMKHLPEVHVNQKSCQVDPHGTAAFPVAFYEGDLVKNAVPWHWHEEIEVILAAKGSIQVGAGTISETLKEGDGCLINGGVLHSVWKADDQPCLYHTAVFHPRLIGGADSVFWAKYIRPLRTAGFPPCILLQGGNGAERQALADLEAAWQADEKEAPGFEIEVRYLLTRLLRRLTETTAVLPPKTARRDSRDMERMKQMLSWIDLHFSELISVGQIAQSAGISESECLRCFRRNVGMSPSQYLIDYRLRAAAEKLRSAGGTVSEAASACGFWDMSYFSRLFKARYGATPTDYAKQ